MPCEDFYMALHVEPGLNPGTRSQYLQFGTQFPRSSEVNLDYRRPLWDMHVSGSADHNGLQPQLIYIPYWVKLALIRNNLEVSDLLLEEKLEKILSHTDIVKFFKSQCVIDECLFENVESIGSLGFYWLLSLYKKYDHLFPMMNTDEIKASTISLLTIEDSNIELDFNKNYHRMELYKDNMILVYVEPGILNALKDRDYVKKFISDYLKAQYTFLPIHMVGNDMWTHQLFVQYMNLL